MPAITEALPTESQACTSTSFQAPFSGVTSREVCHGGLVRVAMSTSFPAMASQRKNFIRTTAILSDADTDSVTLPDETVAVPPLPTGETQETVGADVSVRYTRM